MFEDKLGRISQFKAFFHSTFKQFSFCNYCNRTLCKTNHQLFQPILQTFIHVQDNQHTSIHHLSKSSLSQQSSSKQQNQNNIHIIQTNSPQNQYNSQIIQRRSNIFQQQGIQFKLDAAGVQESQHQNHSNQILSNEVEKNLSQSYQHIAQNQHGSTEKSNIIDKFQTQNQVFSIQRLLEQNRNCSVPNQYNERVKATQQQLQSDDQKELQGREQIKMSQGRQGKGGEQMRADQQDVGKKESISSSQRQFRFYSDESFPTPEQLLFKQQIQINTPKISFQNQQAYLPTSNVLPQITYTPINTMLPYSNTELFFKKPTVLYSPNQKPSVLLKLNPLIPLRNQQSYISQKQKFTYKPISQIFKSTPQLDKPLNLLPKRQINELRKPCSHLNIAYFYDLILQQSNKKILNDQLLNVQPLKNQESFGQSHFYKWNQIIGKVVNSHSQLKQKPNGVLQTIIMQVQCIQSQSQLLTLGKCGSAKIGKSQFPVNFQKFFK